MPRYYARRTSKYSWTDERMTRAINSVLSGEKKIREAGRAYGIPESTIRKRLKENRIDQRTTIGRKPTFKPSDEKEIANLILLLADLFYGLTPKELRRIAFEYAETKNISHRFNETVRLAGKDWLYLFRKRNPHVTLRKSKKPCVNEGCSKEDITSYFANLRYVSENFKLLPSRIFNMNELSMTSCKQSDASATAIFCISASGDFLPPMIIYSRGKTIEDVKGSNRVMYGVSDNGLTNETLFMEWLMHFKAHVNPCEKNPVLLIVDDHTSHISFKAYEFWKQNCIMVVSLPPHTSHTTQPLDLGFYGPYKEALNQLEASFLAASGKKHISVSDFAGLITTAFKNAATVERALSGFHKAGIFPLNPDAVDIKPLTRNPFRDFSVSEDYSSDDSQHLTIITEGKICDCNCTHDKHATSAKEGKTPDPSSTVEMDLDNDKRANFAVSVENVDTKDAKVLKEHEDTDDIYDIAIPGEVYNIPGGNGKSNELWYRCIKCAQLRYKGCADDLKPNKNYYRCELCTNSG